MPDGTRVFVNPDGKRTVMNSRRPPRQQQPRQQQPQPTPTP
jgi:hypothetical protein